MKRTIIAVVAVGFALFAFFSSRGSDSGTERGETVEWNLTYDMISAVPDDEVEFHIVQRVSEAMGAGYEPGRVRQLPAGVRMVYSTWELEADVNNGGFDQYFANTDGALIDEAITGFRLIGANRTAALVERARSARGDRAALDALDGEFYELGEPVQDLRTRYIRGHPEAF